MPSMEWCSKPTLMSKAAFPEIVDENLPDARLPEIDTLSSLNSAPLEAAGVCTAFWPAPKAICRQSFCDSHAFDSTTTVTGYTLRPPKKKLNCAPTDASRHALPMEEKIGTTAFATVNCVSFFFIRSNTPSPASQSLEMSMVRDNDAEEPNSPMRERSSLPAIPTVTSVVMAGSLLPFSMPLMPSKRNVNFVSCEIVTVMPSSSSASSILAKIFLTLMCVIEMANSSFRPARSQASLYVVSFWGFRVSSRMRCFMQDPLAPLICSMAGAIFCARVPPCARAAVC
mmetsp:Transcript_68764/g.201377  ORF Transcript_68764/g.201377 Transcript_68764/m.201377 type:complete len:284 (+) Transcript_68764:2042-2893(+)